MCREMSVMFLKSRLTLVFMVDDKACFLILLINEIYLEIGPVRPVRNHSGETFGYTCLSMPAYR